MKNQQKGIKRAAKVSARKFRAGSKARRVIRNGGRLRNGLGEVRIHILLDRFRKPAGASWDNSLHAAQVKRIRAARAEHHAFLATKRREFLAAAPKPGVVKITRQLRRHMHRQALRGQ
jgi:hypothetical protein